MNAVGHFDAAIREIFEHCSVIEDHAERKVLIKLHAEQGGNWVGFDVFKKLSELFGTEQIAVAPFVVSNLHDGDRRDDYSLRCEIFATDVSAFPEPANLEKLARAKQGR